VPWLSPCGHVDPRAVNMSGSKWPDGPQAALALVGVVVCTKAFTSATRRLGWNAFAVAAVLYVAGHLATKL
jgi:hypothetical protein